MKTMMTLADLAESVQKSPVPSDKLVTDTMEFTLVGENQDTDILFDGASAGPLALYQAKSLAGAPGINVTSTKMHLDNVRNGRDKTGVSRDCLKQQVSQVNAVMRSSGVGDGRVVARTYVEETGRLVLGGLVTRRYAPITHLQLLEKMMETAGLADAMIHKYTVSPGRLEALFLINGSEWTVDGGLKAGMRIHNGQFGDRSYGFTAMMFRLLCTNGMMDIAAKVDGGRNRHVGTDIDLAADVAVALGRADEMFGRYKTCTETECDVFEMLIELYRRGFINRGALKKAVNRMLEAFGGQAVTGAANTVWGLTQALTAAGRDYSLSQMTDLGELAGKLLFQGVREVIDVRPIPNDADSIDEVREYLAGAA